MITDDAQHDAGGPVVVATAMALSEATRARLSESLGPGFLVVDIRVAPATANVVIAPRVSDMALSHLRGMFPQARILFSELLVPDESIDYRGPVYEALTANADGYVLAPTLDALAVEVDRQAGLQLTGTTARTPLELPRDMASPTPATPPHDKRATTPGPSAASSQSPRAIGRQPIVWWINGPFGGGKTTLSTALTRRDSRLRLFDPEEVGFMLRRFITEPVDDFQSWPAWRAVTAETVVQLVGHHHQDLLCPMTLLNEAWAREIFTSIALADIPQRHLVLHADRPTLEQRILHDTAEAGAAAWRLAAIDRYQKALEWLTASADIIDTTHLTPTQVADHVQHLIHPRTPTPTA